MVGTSKLVVFVDTDITFLRKAEEFSTKRGLIVRTVSRIDAVFNLLNEICKKIDVIAINIDSYSIEELKKLKSHISSLGFKNTKILSITGPASKFSGITIEKIKSLTPIDLINKGQNTDQMLFRLVNAIFSDSPKRRNPRIIIEFPVKCSAKDDSFEAVAFSLSMNGIFLQTDRSFHPNSILNIHFKLPESDEEFQIECKVLYDIKAEQQAFQVAPTGIGLFFQNITPEKREKIAKYVKNCL